MVMLSQKAVLVTWLLLTAMLSSCQNCSGPSYRADKTDSVQERAEEMKDREDESLDTSKLPQPGTEHTSGMTGGVVKDQEENNGEENQEKTP